MCSFKRSPQQANISPESGEKQRPALRRRLSSKGQETQVQETPLQRTQVQEKQVQVQPRELQETQVEETQVPQTLGQLPDLQHVQLDMLHTVALGEALNPAVDTAPHEASDSDDGEGTVPLGRAGMAGVLEKLSKQEQAEWRAYAVQDQGLEGMDRAELEASLAILKMSLTAAEGEGVQDDVLQALVKHKVAIENRLMTAFEDGQGFAFGDAVPGGRAAASTDGGHNKRCL